MASELQRSLVSPLGPATNQSDAEKLVIIDDLTATADTIQEKVLEEILIQNAETEYLKRFELSDATDIKTFKAKVPLTTYEDIKPDIQRIANGDKSAILCCHSILEFLMSSGTSGGQSKLLPLTKEELERRWFFQSFLVPIIKTYYPDVDKGKGLYFYFVKSEENTPGGIPARPMLTSLIKSDNIKSKPYDPYAGLTSPKEAILCQDTSQSMYVQMLCGLYRREEVLHIGAPFASSLIRAIHFLQLQWEDLSRDIEIGILNDIVTDESIKDSMLNFFKPCLHIAQFLREECSSGNWEGIIRRVWPNAKFINTIVTGPMAQYVPTLDYFSGALPIVSGMYASSECYFGLNLRPMCKPCDISYTIMPNMAYFEFLPPDSDAEQHEIHPVDLKDVEVGKEYEIVVTTYSGLYRYQVGDILKVTGFHNAAPQFQFVRRKNVLLSIEVDKTDEVELQNAIQHASDLLKDYNTTIVEYTSRVETSTIPAHYVIYWELMSKEPLTRKIEADVLERCCLAIENELSSVYRQGRVETKSIEPLEIKVVQPGTFDKLMDFAISNGSSINQYKTPRCVYSKPMAQLLDSMVVSRSFSSMLPKWKQ